MKSGVRTLAVVRAPLREAPRTCYSMVTFGMMTMWLCIPTAPREDCVLQMLQLCRVNTECGLPELIKKDVLSGTRNTQHKVVQGSCRRGNQTNSEHACACLPISTVPRYSAPVIPCGIPLAAGVPYP